MNNFAIKDVRLFNISINDSNYIDLVIHNGLAGSPQNDNEFNNQCFYIHHIKKIIY